MPGSPSRAAVADDDDELSRLLSLAEADLDAGHLCAAPPASTRTPLDPPRRRGDGEERRAGAAGASGGHQGRRAGVAGAVGGRQEGTRRRGGPARRSAADEGGAQLRGRLSAPPAPGAAADDEDEWRGVVGAAAPYPPPPLGHRACPPTPPLRLLWPPFWCGGGSFGDEAGRFRSNGSSEQRGAGASSLAPEALSS
uniref:Uncharacterized protein n=1 Tax=Oryza nivara TaxID=4536 RepID=A0A0E0H5H2_ORYNI